MTEYVHFIGIGGVSMSGIAKILLTKGIRVSGSDIWESDSVSELRSLGADIHIGHNADNISDQTLVVYTSAVHEDNPEIIEARRRGIALMDRATMLGLIMKDYSNAISVAGTHGKTTATSMLAYILLAASKDPTIMVGGTLDGIEGNLRIGGGDIFVTETCEYMRNFLRFFPTGAIILNIEEDHLDYYKGIDDIISAFSDFVSLVPEEGFVVANATCDNTMKAVSHSSARVYTFGYEDAYYCARNISYNDFGYPRFDIYSGEELVGSIELSVVGDHNVLNALGTALAASVMGIDFRWIKKGLEGYRGTKRRFEKKGMVNGALVIDDYAHHPTEIRATLGALKNIRHNNEWLVFQPHTYTRTASLLDEFAKALSGAQNVIITDIFAAREKDTGIVHASDLAAKIDGAVYIAGLSEVAEYIKTNAADGDVVITMGAGNVCDIAELLK